MVGAVVLPVLPLGLVGAHRVFRYRRERELPRLFREPDRLVACREPLRGLVAREGGLSGADITRTLSAATRDALEAILGAVCFICVDSY